MDSQGRFGCMKRHENVSPNSGQVDSLQVTSVIEVQLLKT